jgi:hypothetical protein
MRFKQCDAYLTNDIEVGTTVSRLKDMLLRTINFSVSVNELDNEEDKSKETTLLYKRSRGPPRGHNSSELPR